MKRILVFSVLISYSSLGLAQLDLDSLAHIWSEESQHDTVRLNALNEFAYSATNSAIGFAIHPDSLLVLAHKMYGLGTRIGSKRYQVDALIQQSRAHLYNRNAEGALAAALASATQAAESAEEIGYLYGEARALALLGVYHLMHGDRIQELGYVNRSYEIISGPMLESPDQPIFGEIKSFPSNTYLFDPYHNKLGLLYADLGAFSKALEHYNLALKAYLLQGNELMVAALTNNIANVHNQLEQYDNALKYYEEALPVFIKLNNKGFEANVLGNMGLIYMNQKSYDKSEEYFMRHLQIREDQRDHIMIARAYMSLANLEIDRKNYNKALDYAGLAEAKLNPESSKYEMTVLKMYQGHAYMELGNYRKAIELFQESSRLSDEMNTLNLKANTAEYLYKVYKKAGNDRTSLAYHEELKTLNDSLNKDETGKKLLQVEYSKKFLTDSLLTQQDKIKVKLAHDKEILEKNNTRNIFMGSGLLLLLISGGLWNRLNFIRKSNKIIKKEKDRSESLLLNILPAEVAEELKENGEALARNFDTVSIIFTDFKSFTETSEKLSAAELVDELNYCFKGFDDIMEKYGIEKIKTIGDAYMAAGGIPISSYDSPKNTVLAALEMQKFISQRKAEQDALGFLAFEMRAGIHTGPIVAGIVGVKKFQYDIWGDTVNTASRMESAGEVGRLNISQDTYELIRDEPDFAFTKREKIEVKGKGEMEMYFVGSTAN